MIQADEPVWKKLLAHFEEFLGCRVSTSTVVKKKMSVLVPMLSQTAQKNKKIKAYSFQQRLHHTHTKKVMSGGL